MACDKIKNKTEKEKNQKKEKSANEYLTQTVLDNILNNICKYAKIDTRVYVELEKREGKTIATFKNISHAELNIPGEELMERFVRGERARNTEGSGLGLSIAKSMMELMEAELKIHVDGDLFKVELIF